MALEEMPFTSTRTDADSYAETALDDLLSHVAITSTRTQCYVRDSLAESFRAGEHQGECRAVLILAIAIRRAPGRVPGGADLSHRDPPRAQRGDRGRAVGMYATARRVERWQGGVVMLIDGATYALPDDTIVRARVPLIGSVRLELQDGTPAYLLDQGRWMSLRYDATTQGYAAAPCDLTDADLEMVP